MSRRHILLFFFLLALLIPSTAMSQSKSKKQLEKEKTQLETEIKRLNAELAKAKKNTKLTNSQLASLNKKIKERNKLIDNINGQLYHLDGQITRMNDSISHIQSRRHTLQEEYAATVRSLYREYNNIDKWVLLFDTPSYNKALLRAKYFKKYNEYRLQQSRKIRETERQLQEVGNALQQQKLQQSELLTQEKRNRDQLAKEQRQKEASVQQSRANEKQLSSQLSAKEKQKRKLQQQIQRLIDEEVRKAAAKRAAAKRAAAKASASAKGATSAKTTKASGTTTKPSDKPAPASTTVTDKTTSEEAALSNDFASNKGRLAWPVAYTSIVRNYGLYTHESGGQNMNNGIDLLTVQGTNVYAVFKGTVSRVFTCPNGTTGIIIRHGEFMTVYCNLASVSVKAGQTIATRAVIGRVANDSDGHGEFSFQLWKGRESQNPRSWLR
ncbi:MAG: peptidoglycan DD-metalloendopeptidase family protein [Bacteroidales bacterium]|nr:peptidoglycan DD-metalloendopeptidase family protein [Bacteroidales bacterium]